MSVCFGWVADRSDTISSQGKAHIVEYLFGHIPVLSCLTLSSFSTNISGSGLDTCRFTFRPPTSTAVLILLTDPCVLWALHKIQFVQHLYNLLASTLTHQGQLPTCPIILQNSILQGGSIHNIKLIETFSLSRLMTPNQKLSTLKRFLVSKLTTLFINRVL